MSLPATTEPIGFGHEGVMGSHMRARQRAMGSPLPLKKSAMTD
ncbi:hypothetical protein [Mesorhizobium salmacidum]|uniref:Uncharacterized protein n=1 Tax=Mesorhizobium salmacidum TaxID=3015171 RepID=A0ABU8KZJ0_9HYPH